MANFRHLCQELGLSDREATLYHLLLTHGPHTVVELSKKSSIPRTQTYRLLDRLTDLQIVQKIIDHHRTTYKAESPDTLDSLLNIRLKRLADLKRAVPDIVNSLSMAQSSQATSVKFYKGETGIAQMVWHCTQAQTEIVGYTYRDLASITGQAFAEDLYLEIIKNKIRIRDIFSDSFVDSMGSWHAAVKATFPHPEWSKLVQSRYLPESKLPIIHQMDIYNHTVAMYNWHAGDIFGVEIVNEKVAAFQKSIFDLIWTLAQPLSTD